MTEHTPGPWRDEGDGWVAVNDPHNQDRRGNGVAICRVRGAQQHQIDANARLIAAAPELLEACRALMTAHRADIETYDEGSDAFKAWDQAEAAIAKAKP